MSFGEWSPSHAILVLFAIAAFIGHVAIMFYRIGQLEKQMKKQGEMFLHAQERLEGRLDRQGETFLHALERLDERMDKQGETFFHALERLEERMDKRFVEVNQQIAGLRTETNQRLSDMQAETNTRLSDMQAETNTRLSDIEASLRQLNQNHIEHLTHHAPPGEDSR